MSHGFFQDTDGNKSCKRLGGMLLIAGGSLLDASIALGVAICAAKGIDVEDSLLQLKSVSTPMYGFGAALVGGGVLESKFKNK